LGSSCFQQFAFSVASSIHISQTKTRKPWEGNEIWCSPSCRYHPSTLGSSQFNFPTTRTEDKDEEEDNFSIKPNPNMKKKGPIMSF